MADPAVVLSIDTQSCTVDDLESVVANVTFTLRCDGPVHGFGSWFDVGFAGLPGVDEGVTLSTSPDAPQVSTLALPYTCADNPPHRSDSTPMRDGAGPTPHACLFFVFFVCSYLRRNSLRMRVSFTRSP
jgi:hypothetical protein